MLEYNEILSGFSSPNGKESLIKDLLNNLLKTPFKMEFCLSLKRCLKVAIYIYTVYIVTESKVRVEAEGTARGSK